jgi:hypothetical protein
LHRSQIFTCHLPTAGKNSKLKFKGAVKAVGLASKLSPKAQRKKDKVSPASQLTVRKTNISQSSTSVHCKPYYLCRPVIFMHYARMTLCQENVCGYLEKNSMFLESIHFVEGIE